MNLPEPDKRMIEAHVREQLSQHVLLDDYDLFFFGSRTQNTQPSKSDVDIGVMKREGGTLPAGVLSDLAEYVREIPTLYVCDIVDFGAVSDEFKQQALQSRADFMK